MSFPVLVLSTATPAFAGQVHIEVPQRVRPGETLEVTVRDCVSGATWNAVVLARIEDRSDGG